MSRPTAEQLDTIAEVETPEHVRFHHHLAGPAGRALAYLLDLLVRAGIAVVVLVVLAIAGIAGGETLNGVGDGLLLLLLFALEWGYYVVCETLWDGRSPGKRALGLRVITSSGQPLNLADSMLRNLLRAADFLPAMYALGGLVMSGEVRFRRLGDLVAGTMVVVEQRFAVSAAVQIHPPPTASELSTLPARLPLQGEDLEALELYLRRLGQLHPARAEELAELVAPVYLKRLALSQPTYRTSRRLLELLYHRARLRTEAG